MRRNTTRRPRSNPLHMALWLCLIVLLSWLGWTIWDTYHVLQQQVTTADWQAHLKELSSVLQMRQSRQAEEPEPLTDRITVLVLGVDDRNGRRGRSDAIMVASLDPQEKTARLLSIPRDTLVEIPGRGLDKLNHAYAFGGPDLSMEAVSRYLDLPLDHYVVIDFQGFRAIVDAVGGIPIRVEQPMHYEDPSDVDGGLSIHFEPGLYQMNGQEALEYARFRSDGQGDIGRMQRQQAVIRAIAQQALSPKNAARLPALVEAAFETVQTDASLTDLLRIALAAREVLQNGTLETATLGASEPRTVSGIFYFVPDLAAAREEAHAFLMGRALSPEEAEAARADAVAFSAAVAAWAAEREVVKTNSLAAEGQEELDAAEPADDVPAETWRAAIYDYSGGANRRGLVEQMAARLHAAGIRVVLASPGESTAARTVILFDSAQDRLASVLSELFPEAWLVPSPLSGEWDVEVRLGEDALRWGWMHEGA